jgi:hypothetical protein
MDTVLMIDPANEHTVGEVIEAIDRSLMREAPESRAHMDAQSLIAIAIQAAQHLDAVSVLVGVLLAKNIKVHIEVGGIALTAKTLKEGLSLIHDLRGLLSNDQETPKKARTRK